MGGGGSSSSQANQSQTTKAWDNRAAATGHAIVATGGATINAKVTDAGAVKAGVGVANHALDVTGASFQDMAATINDLASKALGVAVTTQQNAQQFATVARMDAQTTQMTKLIPWIVGGGVVAFLMARS